jgi:hypothetical protein
MQGSEWQFGLATCRLLQVKGNRLCFAPRLTSRDFRSCFTPLITNKFRRTMETEADSPTKSFLIGFSGSLESSVLLDLVNITYLARQGRGKKYSSLKEGTTVAKVCYVETCGAYPNVDCLSLSFAELQTNSFIDE